MGEYTEIGLALLFLVNLTNIVQTMLARRDIRRSLRPPPSVHAYDLPMVGGEQPSLDPPARKRRDTPRQRPRSRWPWGDRQ